MRHDKMTNNQNVACAISRVLNLKLLTSHLEGRGLIHSCNDNGDDYDQEKQKRYKLENDDFALFL